jgi:hypothetical protein
VVEKGEFWCKWLCIDPGCACTPGILVAKITSGSTSAQLSPAVRPRSSCLAQSCSTSDPALSQDAHGLISLAHVPQFEFFSYLLYILVVNI